MSPLWALAAGAGLMLALALAFLLRAKVKGRRREEAERTVLAQKATALRGARSAAAPTVAGSRTVLASRVQASEVPARTVEARRGDLLPGESRGPYRVVRSLGRGGCAVTYLAEHAETGEAVALKVPHAHMASDEEFTMRFRREARLGAELDHPGIVRVVDPGPDEGESWMAQEFVLGDTLEAHLKARGACTFAELMEVAKPLASALAYAHARGVVHRDLKPANIMFGEMGPRIMDFGIARKTDGESATTTNIFIGTPAYAAPEALHNPRVGPAADRYAFGLMLFEMLTGSAPFKGDTAFAMLQAHQRDPLPDLRGLRPETPPRLVRLIERLCAKTPDQRPEDLEVMAILEDVERDLAEA